MEKFPLHGLNGVTPSQLGWLSGNWVERRGNEQINECWSAPQDNSIMAMFRWLKDGAVKLYEFMSVEAVGAQVRLRIKRFDPGLYSWDEKDKSSEFVLTQLSGREAVFARLNPPGLWMVYRLEEENKLTAFFAQEGEAILAENVFVYQRE